MWKNILKKINPLYICKNFFILVLWIMQNLDKMFVSSLWKIWLIMYFYHKSDIEYFDKQTYQNIRIIRLKNIHFSSKLFSNYFSYTNVHII